MTPTALLVWLLAWSGGFCAGVLAERIRRLSKSSRRNSSTYLRK
jgi:hypothetical protein